MDTRAARPEDATDRAVRYAIRHDGAGGRIQTRSLEAHIVDHCNLTCWGCCSLSPFLPEWSVEPEDLRRDLELARRVLAPGIFKLVGGEPLLHPRLLECLRVARESKIAPVVSVTTNALLLSRVAEEFWDLADALTISVYPKPPLPEETRGAIQAKADRRGVAVNWKFQNEFVDMNLEEPRSDEAVNREVWRECWLRRRCHMLRDGWFYTCTRPVHFDSFYRGKTDFARTDGVKLHDGPGLLEELYAALVTEEPLECCALCRGGDSRHHRGGGGPPLQSASGLEAPARAAHEGGRSRDRHHRRRRRPGLRRRRRGQLHPDRRRALSCRRRRAARPLRGGQVIARARELGIDPHKTALRDAAVSLVPERLLTARKTPRLTPPVAIDAHHRADVTARVARELSLPRPRLDTDHERVLWTTIGLLIDAVLERP